MYLTKEAITSTLKQIAAFDSGSELAMTFYLPMELLDEEDKPMQEIAEKGARESGTPMLSFFLLKKYWLWLKMQALRKQKQYQHEIWNNIIL